MEKEFSYLVIKKGEDVPHEGARMSWYHHFSQVSHLDDRWDGPTGHITRTELFDWFQSTYPIQDIFTIDGWGGSDTYIIMCEVGHILTEMGPGDSVFIDYS